MLDHLLFCSFLLNNCSVSFHIAGRTPNQPSVRCGRCRQSSHPPRCNPTHAAGQQACLGADTSGSWNDPNIFKPTYIWLSFDIFWLEVKSNKLIGQHDYVWILEWDASTGQLIGSSKTCLRTSKQGIVSGHKICKLLQNKRRPFKI